MRASACLLFCLFLACSTPLYARVPADAAIPQVVDAGTLLVVVTVRTRP